VRLRIISVATAIVAAASSPAWSSGSAVSSAVQQAGQQYYIEYCASCHGTDGRGAGPVAAALTIRPPDLSKMAARRNGQYPFDELASYIDGRKAVAAHGSREMPVWG
jgi:mono/diheme cytochrome c family protein